ncbi:MAG: pyridoxal-phosphate-dependent aminotransferase family protein [Candidatus Anammoxibacter sp.]
MKKNYLFTPGPTQVPPEVLLAEAQPAIHHRTPQFSSLFKELSEDLKYLFQTVKGEVYTLSSSGTGGMEACVANVMSRGEKALVICCGKFGERWAEICSAFGVEAVLVKVENGKAVDPAVVEECLGKHDGIKAVFATQSETSTGALNDIEAIAKITKRFGVLLIVDSITGIGIHRFPFDEWDIDIAVTGSQKGCMLPPGLAFVCVSPNAWKAIEASDLPKYYWDFKKMKKSLKDSTTAYTPSVSLIVAMKKALDMIKEEGIENVWKRHARLANATREGIKALGLELFADKDPSNVVTSVKVPEGVDISAIIKKLRDGCGVTFTGGQSELKGKIFRIGHIGYIDDFDIIIAISAVEKGLFESGYPVDLGKGIAAVQKALVGNG